MPDKYAYITGCLILFIIWVFIFVRRKDLQQEMLLASLWGLPFGFIDYFLVPTYWHPDSLFGLMKKYGVGIESFIFIFCVVGIASVLYEFLCKEKLSRLSHHGRPHYWLLIFIPILYIVLLIAFPTKAIYNLMIAGAIGSIITGFLRKDLIKQILFTAFVFSLLYFLIFLFINFIFPGVVIHSYNLNNTWNILILGIPLEEILVAFFAGAFWSTIYEYTRSYREKKML